MQTAESDGSWVVYLMTLHNKEAPRNAVCRQREWDEMERARPGYHQLVRAGIASEAEAEALARAGLVAAELNEARDRQRRREERARIARDAR